MNGKNVPKKKKKLARATRRKAGSLSGLMNSMTVKGFFVWTTRDLVVALVMTSRPSIINATARIVHLNPIRGINLFTIIGKITPPKDEPDAIIPSAVARLFINQVETEFIEA